MGFRVLFARLAKERLAVTESSEKFIVSVNTQTT